MKNISKLIYAGLILFGGLLAACTVEDELNLIPLDTPTVSNGGHTVSSLTFSWDPVENVSQYAYELYDPKGNVVEGDVTTATTVTFTGLQASTTYTLKVWAYAVVGSTSHDVSEIAILTATTDDIVPLEMSDVTITVDKYTATVKWSAVEHAAKYSYSYFINGKESSAKTGTTAKTSLTLTNLDLGEYTFSISAVPDEEAYSESEAREFNFTIEFIKEEIWRVVGTYTPYIFDYDLYDYVAAEDPWEATLVAYNDGSYVLEKWYNIDGYNLEFTVNGTEINVTNYSKDYGDCWSVKTGSETLYVYYGEEDCYFEGNKDEGELSFTTYSYAYSSAGDWGYGEFIWGGSNPTKDLISSIVGTYSEDTVGYDYWPFSDVWETEDYSFHLTPDLAYDIYIDEGEDSGTVTLSYLYWSYDSLVGTVDPDARTITFAAGQLFLDYYKFASQSAKTDPVVAKINDDGTISIDNWAAWSGSYTYVEANTVLTKID